jgi:menaquinone-specific isochorismate synthase
VRAVTIDIPAGTPLAAASLVDLAGTSGILFVRRGRGVAGFGCAARVPIDEAVETLAAIDHEDRRPADRRHGPGSGPVAVGSLGFLPGSAAELCIPSMLVADDGDGNRRLTVIDSDPLDAMSEWRPCEPAPPTAARFDVAPALDVGHYLTAVATARDAVRAGRLDKAVIARPVTVTSDTPMDIHAIGRRLATTFADTYRFSIDGFVGASPELLVEVDGATVRSQPLAGTTRTTGDPDTDARLAAELMASPKNQIEHRAAIEMVRDTLLPWCSWLDWTPEPSIVKVANVQHLGSLAEGVLGEPRPSVIDLVRALQPTPAVGGHPRTTALELIAAVEGFERGRYGGAIGWVDGTGDGTWAVALRCAEFSDDRRSARLVAGGGIVADSDPHAELAETQAKLQAMLGAIVRP